MRKVAALLAPSLLTTGTCLLAPEPASACETTYFGGEVTTCRATLGWTYDVRTRAFQREGVRDADPSAPRFEYVISSRCGDTGVDCGASAVPCPDVDGSPGRMFQAISYLLTAAGVRAGTPSTLRNVCLYADRSVPLSAVQAAVHEELRKRIPSPSVTSAPPGVSLVNLLTIFSTTPAAEQAIAFAQPVPGEVRAVPEYTWDFGDGIRGVGPGKPFTSSVLPSKNPEYYTGAKYTQPGTKHVTLTVTWRVTFRLEGVQDIPLEPIVMTASEDKQIATARGVLVN